MPNQDQEQKAISTKMLISAIHGMFFQGCQAIQDVGSQIGGRNLIIQWNTAIDIDSIYLFFAWYIIKM